MWFVKLALAALFFTFIAEVVTGVNIVGPGEKILTAKAEEVHEAVVIETVGLADAITMANTYVAVTPLRLPEPTKKIAVNSKAYLYNLVIPALHINVGVHGMGLTHDGKMAVPDNYTEVGWYSLGYRPGEQGSAVMGAHVDDGGSRNGVFKNLKRLKVGERIFVGDGDGNVYQYRVTERKVFPYRTAITSDVFLKKDTKRLNVITCYGTWLPKENTYDKRLVVYAELIETTSQ